MKRAAIPVPARGVFPRRMVRYGGLADLGKTQIIGMPNAACRLSRSVWRQCLQCPGRSIASKRNWGRDLTRFPLVTAVMTRCKTVSADGSRWGKRSGRVAFLSLQIQKTERRDGERVADKLCSLGNDWMRSMQVCAVRPIFELTK